MDTLLLCCAVVALASHGYAEVSLGYELTREVTHRRHNRAAKDWLGSSVRNDNVRALDLISQDIQRVPRAAFRNIPNVRSIKLLNTSISDVDVRAFEGVPELEILDLDDNDISSLPEAVFRPVPGLKYLILSGNLIAELSPSHFAGLTRLWELWIINNRAQLHLHNRTFANLPNLLRIELSRSNIQTLPRDVFTGSNRLQYISLNDNKIEELDNSIFYGLTKLVDLSLSGNRLQTLQPAVFDVLPSLGIVDLSYNRITYLSKEDMHFRWSPTVDLQYNRIQHFDPFVYSSDRFVPTFILDYNPYHCSCHMLPFLQKYSRRGVSNLPILNIDGATCDEPTHLRGERLIELTEASVGSCSTTESSIYSASDSIMSESEYYHTVTYSSDTGDSSAPELQIFPSGSKFGYTPDVWTSFTCRGSNLPNSSSVCLMQYIDGEEIYRNCYLPRPSVQFFFSPAEDDNNSNMFCIAEHYVNKDYSRALRLAQSTQVTLHLSSI